MERIARATKDKSVSFALALRQSAKDASQAVGNILRAVGDGEFTHI